MIHDLHFILLCSLVWKVESCFNAFRTELMVPLLRGVFRNHNVEETTYLISFIISHRGSTSHVRYLPGCQALASLGYSTQRPETRKSTVQHSRFKSVKVIIETGYCLKTFNFFCRLGWSLKTDRFRLCQRVFCERNSANSVLHPLLRG